MIGVPTTGQADLNDASDGVQAGTEPVSSAPQLLDSYRGYNLVAYLGLIWGVPQNLGPLDLTASETRSRPGILSGPDRVAVTAKIDSAPASTKTGIAARARAVLAGFATSGSKSPLQQVASFDQLIDRFIARENLARLADGPHRIVYNRAYLSHLFSKIPLPTGKKVLEIGCSDGMVCALMCELGASEVTGVDAFPNPGANFPSSRIKYFEGDGGAIAFEPESFDLVVSIATFEHVAYPAAIFAQISRVLRPGGYAYVQAGPLYNSPFGHHMFGYFDDYPWIHLRMTPEEISEHCARTGLTARIEKERKESVVDYVRGSLHKSHINGLALANYRISELPKMLPLAIELYVPSYEGESLLTDRIKEELSQYPQAVLIEHGFELILRKL